MINRINCLFVVASSVLILNACIEHREKKKPGSVVSGIKQEEKNSRDKDYKEYFSLVYLQNQVELPLKTIQALDKFDIKINASGGGIKGQAESAKLGIARALIDVNAEFRPALKAAGLLRRDPRSVERKKFGKKKARRSFQFSKR